MANKLFVKTSSGTSAIKFYKKTSTGQTQCPVYIKTSTGQERLDQTLVTKTKVFSGYCDWAGSFRNDSSSGTFTDDYSDERDGYVYQGKYGDYYHLGIIGFNSIFKQVREFDGTITKVTLKLKNLHTYSSAGIGTKICGAWSVPTTKPTSFSFDNVGSTSYSDVEEFDKGETRTLTLKSTIYEKIKGGSFSGLRLLSATGFTLSDYGYFAGEGTSRPYIEITVSYQEYE